MKNQFQLTSNEVILKQQSILWMKGKLNGQPGILNLTNKRLVYNKNANPFAGFLFQLFIKSTRSGVVFDIPVDSIKEIGKDKFGLNQILVITYGDGSIVKFGGFGKSYDAWVTELQKAIPQEVLTSI